MHKSAVMSWIATAVVAIAPLRAQSPEQWRDSADRVGKAITALRDSLVKAEPTMREVARHGDLVVMATPEDRSDAIVALDEFAAMRDRWFAGGVAIAGGFRLAITTNHGFHATSETVQAISGRIELVALPDAADAPRATGLRREGSGGSLMIDQFWELVRAATPGSFGLWMHDSPPLSMPTAERRELAMYALVTGVGRIQRGCAIGDTAACLLALDVRRTAATDNGPIFTPLARLDFFLAVLEAGGSGAWQRFRDATALGIEPAIAAAAGMPVDSVVARWRRGLLAIHPPSTTVTASVAAVALAWSALLTLAAIGASRWA